MYRSDLVNVLVQQGGFTREEAEAIVDAMFASMQVSLAKGESIELRGFGTFLVRDYPGYTGRNPRTKEQLTIGPKRGLIFRAAKDLRERSNRPPPAPAPVPAKRASYGAGSRAATRMAATLRAPHADTRTTGRAPAAPPSANGAGRNATPSASRSRSEPASSEPPPAEVNDSSVSQSPTLTDGASPPHAAAPIPTTATTTATTAKTANEDEESAA